jgi:hypothetical protein
MRLPVRDFRIHLEFRLGECNALGARYPPQNTPRAQPTERKSGFARLQGHAQHVPTRRIPEAPRSVDLENPQNNLACAERSRRQKHG